jgi:uncharacterized protein with HEPN domain
VTESRGTLDYKTRRTLLDFLEFAETGARLTACGREVYDGDEMVRLAAEAILHRVGEAVARLDEAFTRAHRRVSWRAMRRMRTVIAHDYGAVDHDLVWTALAHRMPAEAAEVRQILNDQ